MFLSGAVSQNASYARSISEALPAGNVMRPFGTIGLFVPDGTPGVVSVHLYALATVRVPSGGLGRLFMTIVRGTAPTDPVVYSGIRTFMIDTAQPFFQQIMAKGADYDVAVPPNRFLTYTAFIASDTAATRVGPESFNGYAFRVEA